jgi:hypothetical protein
LFINTPTHTSYYPSGLGIDGSYNSTTWTSLINIKALGVWYPSWHSELAFYTTNGKNLNEGMRINTIGNIGIGTSSPSFRFHIRGGNANSDLMTLGTTTTGNFALTSADGGAYGLFGGVSGSGKAWLQVGRYDSSIAYDLILQGSGGNVGIGTTNPRGRLEVNGHIYLPANQWICLAGGPRAFNEDYPRLAITHTGIHGYIDYMDNLHFRANKNWISALTLYGDGTVGVGFGTTYTAGDYRTQGYKLAVNGGILCEEVKVIADVPDADYVFDTDYKLTTLPELESFVKKNRHLPNIPSAEQFKKDGYKVGEMDEMLLRKVEELTLYVIEQQKTINNLKSELEALKKQ